MTISENEQASNSPNTILNNPAGNSFASLPRQVVASLNSGNGVSRLAPDTPPGNWALVVDEEIYPRMKFKERYMETPEEPFQ